MKLLVFSMLVAAAVAGPTHRFVMPDVSGPAPVVPDRETVVIGPAIIDQEPIAVGPTFVDEDVVPEAVATPQAKPMVQIIINVNSQGQIVGIPEVVAPGPVESEIVPEPVIVVEAAPAEIGTPVIPTPVINLPDELN